MHKGQRAYFSSNGGSSSSGSGTKVSSATSIIIHFCLGVLGLGGVPSTVAIAGEGLGLLAECGAL